MEPDFCWICGCGTYNHVAVALCTGCRHFINSDDFEPPNYLWANPIPTLHELPMNAPSQNAPSGLFSAASSNLFGERSPAPQSQYRSQSVSSSAAPVDSFMSARAPGNQRALRNQEADPTQFGHVGFTGSGLQSLETSARHSAVDSPFNFEASPLQSLRSASQDGGARLGAHNPRSISMTSQHLDQGLFGTTSSTDRGTIRQGSAYTPLVPLIQRPPLNLLDLQFDPVPQSGPALQSDPPPRHSGTVWHDPPPNASLTRGITSASMDQHSPPLPPSSGLPMMPTSTPAAQNFPAQTAQRQAGFHAFVTANIKVAEVKKKGMRRAEPPISLEHVHLFHDLEFELRRAQGGPNDSCGRAGCQALQQAGTRKQHTTEQHDKFEVYFLKMRNQIYPWEQMELEMHQITRNIRPKEVYGEERAADIGSGTGNANPGAIAAPARGGTVRGRGCGGTDRRRGDTGRGSGGVGRGGGTAVGPQGQNTTNTTPQASVNQPPAINRPGSRYADWTEEDLIFPEDRSLFDFESPFANRMIEIARTECDLIPQYVVLKNHIEAGKRSESSVQEDTQANFVLDPRVRAAHIERVREHFGEIYAVLMRIKTWTQTHPPTAPNNIN